MSISAATVWELRAGGSDTNGGGYVAGGGGTDWSQQNSPQYSVTDAVTAGTTTITSATAAFGADVVGNLLYIAGGTGSITAGWYQIISRTNSTTIVVDRSTGLTTGTGATLHIGGALATWQTLINNLQAGNSAWVKGSFTVTAALSIVNFQATTGCVITGYGTSRGDAGQATLTTATNSIDLVDISNSYGLVFRQITFSSTAGTRGEGVYSTTGSNNSAGIAFDTCIFDGLKHGVLGDYNTGFMYVSLWLRNCEVKNCTQAGVRNSGYTAMFGCYVHSNGTDGLQHESGGTAGGLVLDRCIFKSNGNMGVLMTSSDTPIASGSGAATVKNCVFSDNAVAGFQRDGNTYALLHFENNISYANGTYGIQIVSTPCMVIGGYNAYGANTTAAYGGNAVAQPGDVTLSVDPFVNRSSGNFALNATTGGGAACSSAGFPGALLAGGTGYESIGALTPNASVTTTIYAITKSQTIFLGDQGEY